MLTGFLILMVFELVGELLQAAFHLPVPGPVIGMLLLAAVLIVAEKRTRSAIVANWACLEEGAPRYLS